MRVGGFLFFGGWAALGHAGVEECQQLGFRVTGRVEPVAVALVTGPRDISSAAIDAIAAISASGSAMTVASRKSYIAANAVNTACLPPLVTSTWLPLTW